MKTKFIRASIVFDYYPDEDELLMDMTDEEQLNYCKETMIEDIYTFVKSETKLGKETYFTEAVLRILLSNTFKIIE